MALGPGAHVTVTRTTTTGTTHRWSGTITAGTTDTGFELLGTRDDGRPEHGWFSCSDAVLRYGCSQTVTETEPASEDPR